jgi:hypothetical protein
MTLPCTLLRALVLRHTTLEAENSAQRQQLAVLQRFFFWTRLRRQDRLFWAGLANFWAGWQSALLIVSPPTVAGTGGGRGDNWRPAPSLPARGLNQERATAISVRSCDWVGTDVPRGGVYATRRQLRRRAASGWQTDRGLRVDLPWSARFRTIQPAWCLPGWHLRQGQDYWDRQIAANLATARGRGYGALTYWRRDGSLAGVRGLPSSDLSPAERKACVKLWDDVARLLQRARP